uniref:Uncharacterized protein n=1 Tax=Theropithecus gelada TaxID=9565 RepID=A0A8D2JV64_THEGE
MGKQNKTRKYANMRRMLSLRGQRLKEKDRLKSKKKEKKNPIGIGDSSCWGKRSSPTPFLLIFPI